MNNWNIENSGLIDDYAYLPEPEEAEDAKEEAEATLIKSNIFDKAINLFKP
jgi:hypothetical protein